MRKRKENLEVASHFWAHSTREGFKNFLKEQFDCGRQDIGSSPVHEAILRAGFFGLIRTNLDQVFEHHGANLDPAFYPQMLDTPGLLHQRGFFAKIHGCIKRTGNPDDFLLTKESY